MNDAAQKLALWLLIPVTVYGMYRAAHVSVRLVEPPEKPYLAAPPGELPGEELLANARGMDMVAIDESAKPLDRSPFSVGVASVKAKPVPTSTKSVTQKQSPAAKRPVPQRPKPQSKQGAAGGGIPAVSGVLWEKGGMQVILTLDGKRSGAIPVGTVWEGWRIVSGSDKVIQLESQGIYFTLPVP